MGRRVEKKSYRTFCRTYVAGNINGGIAEKHVKIVPIKYIIEKYKITLKNST